MKADSLVGGVLLSSSSPVTVGLLLAERSHGRIGVSYASSVAGRFLIPSFFPQTKLSVLCVPSPYLTSAFKKFSLASFSFSKPPLISILISLTSTPPPPPVPVKGRGRGGIDN